MSWLASQKHRTWKVEQNIFVRFSFKSLFSSHRAPLNEPLHPLSSVFIPLFNQSHLLSLFHTPVLFISVLEMASESQKLCTEFVLPGGVAVGSYSFISGDFHVI